MKNYLKALQEQENSNDSFEMLCSFIAKKDSDIIKLFCNGKIHIPSSMLLKKLHLKFKPLIDSDPELDMLFSSIIKCSKFFYSQTIDLLKNSNDDDFNFDYEFTEKSQPIGQQFVNLLYAIKQRIRVVRYRRQRPIKNTGNSTINRAIKKIESSIDYIKNNIRKLQVMQSSNATFTKKIYCAVIIIVLFTFWFSNMFLFSNIHFAVSTFINIVFCALITLLSILTYSAGHFGKIDIDGKNIVAYRYQVFFNNIANKKMYQVFKILHDNNNDSNESINDTIKSIFK